MTNHVLLDNVTHQNLKVRTGHGAAFGDNVNMTLVLPTEFAYVQREYPILFRKDAGGDYQAVALLGLDEGENLFLDEKGWNARYIPAVQQRGPFLIGFQQKESGREPMVHIDLDHPRVSKTEGEPLFAPQGGNAPYLTHVTRVLQMIYQGMEMQKAMFTAFEDAALIQGMDLEVQLSERVKYNLPDFYTIDRQRLAELNGVQLERLNQLGYLHLAMLVVTSLGNMSWLIDVKNRRLAAG